MEQQAPIAREAVALRGTGAIAPRPGVSLQTINPTTGVRMHNEWAMREFAFGFMDAAGLPTPRPHLDRGWRFAVLAGLPR